MARWQWDKIRKLKQQVKEAQAQNVSVGRVADMQVAVLYELADAERGEMIETELEKGAWAEEVMERLERIERALEVLAGKGPD